MKKNKFLTLYFLLLFGFTHTEIQAQKVATSALQFLKVMPSARATAMGDAYAAMAWGLDAAYWNPGGVAGITSHEFNSTYTMWLFDTKQYALAYGLSLEGLGQFAFQFQMTDIGEIRETRVDMVGSDFWTTGIYNDGYTGRTFEPLSWLIGVSYAKKLTNEFSVGLTMKYVYESLWSGKSITITNAFNQPHEVNTYTRALLFDFGMRFNTGYKSIQIGAAVQNFGADIKFANEEYPAPMTLRLGIKSDLMGQNGLLYESQNNRISVDYDMIQPNDYSRQAHLGLEYSLWESIALRAGYKFNYDSDGLTLGAGVNGEIAGASLSFDYSYGDMGEFLGNVHRISLGVKLK
jgi:hypothetical protein